MVFTLFKKITSISTSKPSTPSHIFLNPLDQDVSIDKIELTPDTFFRKYGAIVIEVNNNDIVNLSSGDIKNYSVFVAPLESEKILKRQNKINCFVWNPVNSNQVAIAVNIGVK